MDVEYVFQNINDLPVGFSVPEGRIKPWGTGQAILCCKDIVKDPFVIINADDYYGKVAFKILHDFLIEHYSKTDKFRMGMAGFVLKNTLSKNGTVTRGICITDENNMLLRVRETKGIGYNAEGKLVCAQEENMSILNQHAIVSMNMWAGYPEFINYLEKDFISFLNENGNSKDAEYLLPTIIDNLLQNNKATVKVMKTHDKWIGITYAEDTKLAQESFRAMVKKGIYSADLWNK